MPRRVNAAPRRTHARCHAHPDHFAPDPRHPPAGREPAREYPVPASGQRPAPAPRAQEAPGEE
eukprot:4471362-Alexandrium_andersonii.AAC.1